MSWPHYSERVTVVDVLDTGACYDGVKAWVLKNRLIAGDTKLYVADEYIARAACADGYGNGDGYGYGDGYGDGNGYGNGNGDGYGYGYGYGNGNGDGYGYGYGDGNGDGYGGLGW